MAAVGIYRAEHDIVLEHHVPVELASIDTERAPLRRDPGKAEHPVWRDRVHCVEDELANSGALHHDVGCAAGRGYVAVVIGGADRCDKVRLEPSSDLV